MLLKETLKAYKGLNSDDQLAQIWGRQLAADDAETYTPLTYIKSTGTQVISTDIIPSFYWTYKMDCKLGNPLYIDELGIVLFGYWNTTWGFSINFQDGPTHSDYDRCFVFYLGYVWEPNESNYYLFNPTDFTSRKILTAKRGTNTCSWGSQTASADKAVTAAAPTVPIPIMGCYYQATGKIIPYTIRELYLYGLKIYDENDTLIHDLQPAERNSDGEAGLYDTVTGKFYTNVGTGELVKGERV